jgi:hypothetical protein
VCDVAYGLLLAREERLWVADRGHFDVGSLSEYPEWEGCVRAFDDALAAVPRKLTKNELELRRLGVA